MSLLFIAVVPRKKLLPEHEARVCQAFYTQHKTQSLWSHLKVQQSSEQLRAFIASVFPVSSYTWEVRVRLGSAEMVEDDGTPVAPCDREPCGLCSW